MKSILVVIMQMHLDFIDRRDASIHKFCDHDIFKGVINTAQKQLAKPGPSKACLLDAIAYNQQYWHQSNDNKIYVFEQSREDTLVMNRNIAECWYCIHLAQQGLITQRFLEFILNTQDVLR